MTYIKLRDRGETDRKEEHLATLRNQKSYFVWHHTSAEAMLTKDISPWKLHKYLRRRSNGSRIFKALCRKGSGSLNVEGIHLFDPEFIPGKDDPMYCEKERIFDLWHQTKKAIVNRLKQELDVLSKLEHKNVVKYAGMDMGENDIFVFSSFLTTRTSIKQYKPMEEIRVSLLTRDILNGLACLHSNNLAHRELRCDNIFIQTDGSVKIGNIGWIKNSDEHEIISYIIDEPEWSLAPEVVDQNHDRGPEADIWNLGTTLLEMLIGHEHSWPKYDHKTIPECIEELLNVPHRLSNNARDFIRRCFERDPSKRPSAKELLAHPFVSWLEHHRLVPSSPEVIKLDDSQEVPNNEES